MILQNLRLQVPKKDFNMEESSGQKDKVENYIRLAETYLRKGDFVKELNSRKEFLEFLQSEPGITEWSIAFAKLVLAECMAYRCELNPSTKSLELFKDALASFSKEKEREEAYHRALLGVTLFGENDQNLPNLIECYDYFKSINLPNYWKMTLKGLVRFSDSKDEYTPRVLVWMTELIETIPNTRLALQTEMLKCHLLLKMQRPDLSLKIISRLKAFSNLPPDITANIQKIETPLSLALKGNLIGIEKLSSWRMCQYCNAVEKDLLKCGKCKIVHYCGVECQKKDWTQHKKVCKN